ncbi:hypothetical protein [Sphingomonas sp. PP-CC-3A-396]|uniref:hypothetical protein n=1 Tax=Sphingomonas sp. PP-CC-3A-396 TaxID=2135655 RepID=UPI001053EFC8|nr:hypothetical protein [Sphingomonas sp. PP-CC-3A-396]TCQ02329.1 hypothetical protein C8J40_11912 [Sphingomonas sp. PP-CC-3A-396]
MTKIAPFAISALMLASPAAAQIDPVARVMVRQALSVATAPTTTSIVGGEQPNTPAVARSLGMIGNSPTQVNGSAANDTGFSRSNTARTARASLTTGSRRAT